MGGRAEASLAGIWWEARGGREEFERRVVARARLRRVCSGVEVRGVFVVVVNALDTKAISCERASAVAIEQCSAWAQDGIRCGRASIKSRDWVQAHNCNWNVFAVVVDALGTTANFV